MEPFEVKALLEKYQSGNCSEKEKQMLESWDLLSDSGAIASLTNKEFSEDLLFIRKGLPIQPVVVVKMDWWPRVVAIAASIILVAGAYLIYPNFKQTTQKTEMVSLQAKGGQLQQIKLSDQSKVWVNAQSTLRYPATFSGDKREVYLSGEAYFDVNHNEKPFIIHTGKLIVTVLGTAFNIKEDKSQKSIIVTVTRGKVSVANGKHTLGVITPNEQIQFDLQNDKFSKQAVNALEAIAWKKIDLNFEDVTFAEAARQLETRYRVKISFKNPALKTCRFTGASLNGENLSKVLDVICSFNNASYQLKSDGTVLIDGQGCENK